MITKKIVILGRGESLKRLIELKEEIDTVILVNCFWDADQVPIAYYKDELIHNFLKTKKLILIMNPSVETSKLNVFRSKYNVINAYTNVFSSNLVNNGKVLRNTNKKKGTEPIPDILRPEWINMKINYSNIGSLGGAFLYAKYYLKCTDVYIFGVDFYERDYYLKNNHNYENEKSKSEHIKKLWLDFLSKHNDDINIHFYTFADFELKVPFPLESS